jgi:hypothetical protein
MLVMTNSGIAHVVAIISDGSPQGDARVDSCRRDALRFIVPAPALKDKNVHHDPRVSVYVPDNPYRYLQVRGPRNPSPSLLCRT